MHSPNEIGECMIRLPEFDVSKLDEACNVGRFLAGILPHLGGLGAAVDDGKHRADALAALHNRGAQAEDFDEGECGEGEHQVSLDDVGEADVGFSGEDVGGVPEQEGVAGEEEELGCSEGDPTHLAPDEAAPERLLQLLAVELQHLLASREGHDGVHVGHGLLQHPPSSVVRFPYVSRES